MSPIEILRGQLAANVEELDALLADAEARELDETETARVDELRTAGDELASRLTVANADEQRRALAMANAPAAAAVVKSEPQTYGRGSGRSFYLDVARAQIRNDQEAWGRLRAHENETQVELRSTGAVEQRAGVSRVDGAGGYFVPPLWLINEYIPFLRAGRVTANLARSMDLPGGTDSINIPKLASGTTTAVQTADNSAVSSTNITDSSISAPVVTIAGQQDVAIQLLDQSPISFDEVIFADLIASYNQQLDLQVMTGTGSSGQVLGLDNAGGTSVAYTTGSPTGVGLYPIIGQALSQVAKARFQAPNAIVMHPRRWFWLITQEDSQGRPLVTPYAQFNGLAKMDEAVAQGAAGNILGVDVYLDANVGTSYGAGTNQDEIYVLYTPDLLLWEGSLRSRAMTEVLSGTLQVRLQVYNYAAFSPQRYPQGVAVIGGTGLVAPSGF